MKKPKFFENSDEKNRFTAQVNESNSFRLMFFIPVQIAVMLFEMVKDIYMSFFARTAEEFVYLHVSSVRLSHYNLYCLIELLIVLFSLAIFFINLHYKKNPEKLGKLFHHSLVFYCSVLLLNSILLTILDSYVFRQADLTLFYFESLVVTSLFYLPPFIVVPEILVSNGVLWTIISIFNWDTVFSPYKPYCVLLLLGYCLSSVLRAHYRLQALRREEKIQQFQQEAEHRDKLKSMFLANMSHEIRTPMNAIVGMSELALDYNLDAAQKNNLRQIHSSALALVAIINDILDFSKIESGKMEICSVDFDLLKTVYDVANVAKVKIQGKDIQLIVEIDPELAVTYNGDDLRLRQILINLAGNAAKFTEKGYVIIRVENLKTYEQKEGLRFNVIDSGEGIKQEDLEKLFNAFQQVDMKANRTKEGTGLGLSISKNLVQLMGGNIGVKSEYGKGSCFYFNLPFSAVSEEKCGQKYKELFDKSEENEYHGELRNLPVESLLDKGEFAHLFAEKSEGAAFVCPDARILVVDDNDVNLQVAKGLLSKSGIDAETAESGFDALKIIENKKASGAKAFDLIFMDHQMPVMDGIETLQKLREKEKALGKHSIVIALSANAVNGASEMFINSGFDDFLSKPVTGKDFARCLKKWLKPELIKNIEEKNADVPLVAATVPEAAIFDSDAAEVPEDFEKPDASKIDLQSALELSGGFENWLAAAKTFYKAIESKGKDIQNFLTTNDYKNFTIAVHALKSSARIIGAVELSQKAKELENLGNQIQDEAAGDKGLEQTLEQEIKTKTNILLQLYNAYSEILRKSVSYKKEQQVLLKADNGKIEELLNSLKAAALDSDLTAAENCVKKLAGLELSEPFKEKLSELQEAVETIDFDRIVNIIE